LQFKIVLYRNFYFYQETFRIFRLKEGISNKTPYVLNRRRKMPKKKMRRTEMYLTEKQHKEVLKEAEERGISFSEMFRKIVDNYLERK